MSPVARTRPLELMQGGDTTEQATKQYMKRYQALGKNAKPDQVADSVFSAYPSFRLIEVNVRQNVLDRKTAHIVEGRQDQFRYRRNGGMIRAE